MRAFRAKSATPPRDPLDLALLPWLIATAACTILPHADAMPPWLIAGAIAVLALRVFWWRRGRLHAPGWLVVMLALLGSAGVLVEFRTIFGRDPGVALLVMLMSLKLLEQKRRRDAVVVVMLGYFLLLTHYFYADGIPVGVWMLLTMGVATATLIRIQAPRHGAPAATLKLAGLLILQALPIMAVLFVLFPRISGPLWGLPQDAHKAKAGLSDRMSPGSFSEISQSSALAFRAEFTGALPPRDRLYWRGPVMSDYDGRNWMAARLPDDEAIPSIAPKRPPAEAGADAFAYTLTIEPHQQRWLLALDLPTTLPANGFLSPTLTVLARQPLRERQRVAFVSTTDFRAGIDESPRSLRRNLALPGKLNPRARELASAWRQRTTDANQLSAIALAHFAREGFVYTLQPPLLGRDAVDEFLFQTKRGFCEHFASAYVVLMRAAGVPARVVGGYQGGEVNPVDGHLVIRQSDAHAWAEIWLPSEGWRRVDPTAYVAPGRVEVGLRGALPEGETLPALLRPEFDWLRAATHRWDSLEYAWNLWVLGYNEERQRALLNRWGIERDGRELLALLSAAVGVLVLGLALWMARPPRQRDPVAALWQLASRRLARRGAGRAVSEGPLAYADRLAADSTVDPATAALARRLATLYIRLRYASDGRPSKERDADLAEFFRAVGEIAPRTSLWSIRFWASANQSPR